MIGGRVPKRAPAARELITLKDAGTYITKLQKAEHEAPEWQAAVQALILVATSGGPTMLARIGMLRALSRHQQQRTKPAAEGDQKYRFAEDDLARARVSWLISPEAPGTSHLIGQGRSDGTGPKRFRTSERPRILRERSWPRPEMSVRARLILICRNGRSPQRIFLNGSKNRMKTIRLEQAGSPPLSGCAQT